MRHHVTYAGPRIATDLKTKTALNPVRRAFSRIQKTFIPLYLPPTRTRSSPMGSKDKGGKEAKKTAKLTPKEKKQAKKDKKQSRPHA